MAALDRRNPNLDDFVGLNWSSWIDRANILPSDGSVVEECNKYGKKRTDTMTLRKEDMSIYGHCPAHDDFYLVVCSQCGLVVKPQAFEKHCERCHGPPGKLRSPPSPSASQQRPRPGRPPSLAAPSRERQDSRHQAAGPPSTTPSFPQHRPAKTQKEGVSLALAQESPPSPSHSSTRRPRVPPWHSGPQRPDGLPSFSSEKPSLQRVVTGQAEDPHTAPRGTKTYSRTFKKVYKKECDLDKHCGVLDPERKKLCTRQLMCNIHSIHQRRKVVGRSKTFDQLVTEQRAGSKSRELERPSPEEPSPHGEPPEDPTGSQHSRHALNNCAILRSRESSESGEEEDGESVVEVAVQPPYPFNQSLPSSEGSDSEDQDEAGDLPATPWHPKPLGLCTFGSRTLGCSVFTFDRRLHHLRFALSAMVEHHLSACLWKKIPQVTGLRSRQAPTTAPTTTGSSGRAGGGPAPPTGPSLRSPPPSLPHRAAGRENCSSGQSETQSNQRNPPSAGPLSSTPRPRASGTPRPGRPRNPVGRPSKARLREQELTANAERTEPHHNEDQALPKRIRDHPLQERGRSQGPARVYPSPSSQGPINGAFALGKKPCIPQSRPSGRPSPSLGQGKRPQAPLLCPPQPPPRGRGRPPGLHRRLVGYDHRDLAKKRKGGSPLSLSPPPSRAPKSRCLSSPSHSSLLSWRGGSMGGALARGLEKRTDPQQPKLQH